MRQTTWGIVPIALMLVALVLLTGGIGCVSSQGENGAGSVPGAAPLADKQKKPISTALMDLENADAKARADNNLLSLVNGVQEIAAPGVPGPLSVSGAAFAIVVGKTGNSQAAVVAAGPLGAGRVVAFGHPGYFDSETLSIGDTGPFVINAVRWAGKDKGGLTVGVQQANGLLQYLRLHGISAKALDRVDRAEQYGNMDVLLVRPSSLASENEVEAVREFVRRGGGLICADLGWGWLQLNPGKRILDHPGNRLLASSGILWADGYLERTAGNGFAIQVKVSPLTNADRALDALLQTTDDRRGLSAEENAQASSVIMRAVLTAPEGGNSILPRLSRLQEERSDRLIPTHDKPLTDPIDRLLLAQQIEELRSAPPDTVRANPAADVFPGRVPADAPRVARKTTVDTSVPGWHSTGLYAAPGETITVVAPKNVGKDLQLRIGAHTDVLWDIDSWSRAPEIVSVTPLKGGPNLAANAFGGLVYFDVPQNCRLGTLVFETIGAVEAPYFVLGRTDQSLWRNRIRNALAPWAELETSKIILTVPSRVVRKLDDPEQVMKWWDRVWDAEADLAAWPPEPVRAERIVADEQISAGYMHSGYPIMTWLDVAEMVVDYSRLAKNGSWGHFHELGHNHQSGDWTFEGTVEVTENLFTLYAFEKVVGPKNHDFFTLPFRLGKRKEYFASGRSFEKWKEDPFLALDMYAQMEEAFGWEAFKKVFAEYRSLSDDQRPRNDSEKRDQWLVRFSRAVGRNLGPFFEAWGVPTTDSARRSIESLPVWLPPLPQ